jgi:hypothetical protein
MKIPFFEIYYASTQFNLLTKTGGFGVRTHTEGIPLELIDRLKGRNLFYYEAGKKPLSGVHELLQNPDLPADFPKTYACFRETIGDKNWLVLSRTAFIGRDYGWYLDPPEQNARTGNTFTHAVCLEETATTKAAQARLFRHFVREFLPKNLRNDSSNPELRRLLTNVEGEPKTLPVDFAEIADTPTAATFSAEPGLAETVLAVYHAFETGKKVVLVLDASRTEAFAGALLECLPGFLLRQFDFVANFHEFNLESRYKLLFVNEYYDRPLDDRNPNLLFCNCISGQFPSLPRSDFYDYVRELLTRNDLARLRQILSGMDDILESFEQGLSLEQVFYAWHFLWSGEPSRYSFQPEAVIRQLDAYPLTRTYRERINRHILDNFLEAIQQSDHAKIAASLNLVDDLNLQGQSSKMISVPFTDYFLDKNNATELMKSGVNEHLVLSNLSIENRADELSGFISRNELMRREVMDYFVVQFCLAEPEQTESFIYMAMLGAVKPDHRLGEELLKQMDDPFEFVVKNDFFVHIGEEGQRLIFDQAIKNLLIDMYQKNQDPVFRLKRALLRVPQALPYHHFMAEKIMMSDPPRFRDLITLLETYATFIDEAKPDKDTLAMMNNLIRKLIQNADHAYAADWDFLKNKILPIEKSLEPSKNESPAYRWAKFVRTVLQEHDAPERLKDKIEFFPDERVNSALLPIYLQFLLAATSTAIWQEEEKARKFVRFLFQKEDEANSWLDLRYNTDEASGKMGLTDYIPWYMSKVVKAQLTDAAAAAQALEDFYCNYTFGLWALSRKKRESDDPPAKEYFWHSNLLKRIAQYLFELRERDRPLLQRVVTRICSTEGDQRILELKEDIGVKFESDMSGPGLFSGFKNFFIKKD